MAVVTEIHKGVKATFNRVHTKSIHKYRQIDREWGRASERARAKALSFVSLPNGTELQIYFLIKNPRIYSISIVVLITNISTFELSIDCG